MKSILHKRHGLTLELSDCCYTPCMVFVGSNPATSDYGGTYDCATQAGDLDGYELSAIQLAWLESLHDIAEKHYNKYRDLNE